MRRMEKRARKNESKREIKVRKRRRRRRKEMNEPCRKARRIKSRLGTIWGDKRGKILGENKVTFFWGGGSGDGGKSLSQKKRRRMK